MFTSQLVSSASRAATASSSAYPTVSVPSTSSAKRAGSETTRNRRSPTGTKSRAGCPAVDSPIAARTAAAGRVAVRPAGQRRPVAVRVADDDEVGFELAPVLAGQRLERREVAGQARVGHVRAEDGQRGDQRRLRRGESGSIVREVIERDAGGFEVGRRALERSCRDRSCRRGQHRAERRGDEHADGDHDARFEAAMPCGPSIVGLMRVVVGTRASVVVERGEESR